MTYNEKMRLKLRGNIIVVASLLALATIFFFVELYHIFFAKVTVIDIQNKLILLDYLVIILFVDGVLALLYSIFAYKRFDNYYPKGQLKLYLIGGILFLPYTVVLYAIGIQRYMEKTKLRSTFIGYTIFLLLVFGAFYSVLIPQLAKIEPEYLSEYTYEAEYVVDEYQSITVSIKGTARGTELLKVDVDAQMTLEGPNQLEQGRIVRISMNQNGTCVNFPYTEDLVDHTISCTIDDFSQNYYTNWQWDDFVRMDDIYIELGAVIDAYLDINGYDMTITNQELIENIYE